MTTPSPTPTSLLSILCLHDGNSTAGQLKEQFHQLGEQLYASHAIDLVYVNSPLTTTNDEESTGSNTEDEQSIQPNNNAIPRMWWDESATNRRNETNDITASENADTSERQPQPVDSLARYRGLDASLMLLRQVWTSRPFWGIIGVGQGAAVASLLIAILDSANQHHHECLTTDNDDDDTVDAPRNMTLLPMFAVFVSGESLIPVHEPLLTRIEDMVALHLVDFDPANATDNDETLENEARMTTKTTTTIRATADQRRQRLVRQFPNGSIEQRRCFQQKAAPPRCQTTHHPLHHSAAICNSAEFGPADLNVIGRFVIERKKELLGSRSTTTGSDSCQSYTASTGQELLALQTALHYAEQDAADCIAEQIALGPPAALMAVIRPQAVAGWKGNRRRQPGDEGGGAPCPLDFVLHPCERGRHNHNGGSSGVSRFHPEYDADHARTELSDI